MLSPVNSIITNSNLTEQQTLYFIQQLTVSKSANAIKQQQGMEPMQQHATPFIILIILAYESYRDMHYHTTKNK